MQAEKSTTINKISDERKNFKFDAFISYNHNPATKRISREIEKLIAGYRAPKRLRSGFLRKAFIDQGDLAAAAIDPQITGALKESKYLIALSSPEYARLPNTKIEVEKFLEFHGEKIIVTLVSGSPSESLEPLKELGLITPTLAADIRPETDDEKKALKQSLKKLRSTEIFRILARILECEPNELIQREKKRKRITVIRWVCVALAVVAVSVMAYQIYQTREREKARETIHQNVQTNLNKVNESIKIAEKYFPLETVLNEGAVLDLEREATVLRQAVAPIYNITTFSEYRLDNVNYYESIYATADKSGLDKEFLKQYYYNLERLQSDYLFLQDKLASFCRNSTQVNYDILMLSAAQVWTRSYTVYYNAVILFDDLYIDEPVSPEDAKALYLAMREQDNIFTEKYNDLMKKENENIKVRISEGYESLRATDDDDMEALLVKAVTLRILNKRDMALEVYDVWERKFGQEDGMSEFLEIARHFTRELDYSRGAYIMEVFPDSIAVSAGLKQHDVIVSYNGATFSGITELINSITLSAQAENTVIFYRLEGDSMTMHKITVPAGKLGMALRDL